MLDHTGEQFFLNEWRAVLEIYPISIKEIKRPSSKRYKTVATLATILKLVKYDDIKKEGSGPSCSLVQAPSKQDLFINSTLAQLGCNILWKLFRNGMIEHHGVFLNLNTMKVNPISV